MLRRFFNLTLTAAFLLPAVPLYAQTSATSDSGAQRDKLFQSAVSAYESGHYAEAVPLLEKLVREVPDSFEVHELLGLAYAAQLEDSKANEHLARAVRIKPNDVAARSNL